MRVRAAAWLAFSAPIGIVASCGSRTGLLVPPPHDATAPDVAADVSEEPDVLEEPEASEEADADADAGEDAPPMIEETVDICTDAGSTLVYVMTSQNVLMSFYPPTATFTTIGTLTCPDPGNDTPFSMAVDRGGIAYVLFESGHLYRVSTRTAVCVPTKFAPGIDFTQQFGMGFSANADTDGGGDGGETLYIAGDPGWATGMPMPSTLGTLDVKAFTASSIAGFTPPILQPELTGTGAGKLYAFWAPTDTADTSIVEIDKTTAAVTTLTTLPGVFFGGGWAFAFWGGDFYTFTAPNGFGTSSVVTRYRPSDGSIVQVATASNLTIVGAGVSTCAPQM
ncbi:MAG TPA: hypothetical protein VF765_28080 [Polyangiaceae bacterium]